MPSLFLLTGRVGEGFLGANQRNLLPKEQGFGEGTQICCCPLSACFVYLLNNPWPGEAKNPKAETLLLSQGHLHSLEQKSHKSGWGGSFGEVSELLWPRFQHLWNGARITHLLLWESWSLRLSNTCLSSSCLLRKKPLTSEPLKRGGGRKMMFPGSQQSLQLDIKHSGALSSTASGSTAEGRGISDSNPIYKLAYLPGLLWGESGGLSIQQQAPWRKDGMEIEI